nr:MAG TPA: hypothetical protein [Caudoviricetes sp.]
MLVKTLLNTCATGFDLVIVADSTSGHTYEYDSIQEAQIVAGSDRIVSWEAGVITEISELGRKRKCPTMVLFITI